MEATPKRKNRQRDSNKNVEQYRLRRYDFDSTSCSSSESGGISPPSKNLPLHYHQPPYVHNDSSSTGSPGKNRSIQATGNPETPTPTTTIENSRSPRSKQLSGKLSRPRRRSHRSFGNLNMNSHLNNNRANIHMSDCSLNSLDSTSDNSRLSRYTVTSKNTVGSGNTGLSRRGASSNSLHGIGDSQQHFFSSNSLLGLGLVPPTPKPSTNGKQQSQDTYDYYHKHEHHPQHHESYTSTWSPTSPTSLPPLPSIRVIASELCLVCKLYGRYGVRYIRRPCRTFRKIVLNGLLILAAIVLILVVWLCYDFYADAIDVCMPPPSSRHLPSEFSAFLASMEGGSYFNNSHFEHDNDHGQRRPLVEYYVHGRGIGHYARSVAIVEQLNRAGVDVRMFLTRASLWRAMHEDSKIIVDFDTDQRKQQHEEGQNHGSPRVTRGKTTAIAITSLTPDQGVFDSLSHALERISGDCEVSASSGRYPQLVISDGDFPGMIRAEIGGIPSVGIAHGQLFSIAQKPKWVQESAQLNGAWDKQGRLNHVSSYFAEWQIATHFCFLESRYNSGTVARAPLRPEVLNMAEARKWARRGKILPSSVDDKSSTINTPRLPQAGRIKDLLFTTDELPTTIGSTNKTATNGTHRKLVICYFRDHNGEHLVQALLDADFDVLLFETGYTKDMANNPYRYGAKWIIEDKFRDEEREKYTPGGNGANLDASRLREQNLEDVDHDGLSNSNKNHKTLKNNSSLTIEGHGFEVRITRADGPKLIRVMDRSLFVPLMHVADGVASSAGSQLMSECIYSHMPLLAMFKEDDTEQRLNVELSHHVNAPCHRPLVFGNSFESLTLALQFNHSSTRTNDFSRKSDALKSFRDFVQEVRSSSVSDTFFRNVRLLDENNIQAKKSIEMTSKNMGEQIFALEDSDSDLDEEDPFRGLPDAAAIILEIIKQVVQKR